jgi:hypothetical protein
MKSEVTLIVPKTLTYKSYKEDIEKAQEKIKTIQQKYKEESKKKNIDKNELKQSYNRAINKQYYRINQNQKKIEEEEQKNQEKIKKRREEIIKIVQHEPPQKLSREENIIRREYLINQNKNIENLKSKLKQIENQIKKEKNVDIRIKLKDFKSNIENDLKIAIMSKKSSFPSISSIIDSDLYKTKMKEVKKKENKQKDIKIIEKYVFEDTKKMTDNKIYKLFYNKIKKEGETESYSIMLALNVLNAIMQHKFFIDSYSQAKENGLDKNFVLHEFQKMIETDVFQKYYNDNLKHYNEDSAVTKTLSKIEEIFQDDDFVKFYMKYKKDKKESIKYEFKALNQALNKIIRKYESKK